MIKEANTPNIPQILSAKAQELYQKFKAFIMKIYSMIKSKNDIEDLKEEFWHSYVRFARKLKEEGFENECHAYMAICRMYHHLMDRPKELIAHREFFSQLYDSFDEILYIRINNPETYDEKYDEYMGEFIKHHNYFYSKVAKPSPHYDEKVLHKIESNLFKVIE